jgi:serpin B
MIVLTLVSSLACAKTDVEPAGEPGGITAGYNSFGIELLKREFAIAADDNVFLSPASISICIGMAYNGAGGQTASEIASILGASTMTLEDYNEANLTLTARLADTGGGITLSIANSMWLRKGMSIREGFVERNEKSFGAGVFELESAKEINDWVKEKTEGMIDSILDSVSPDDIAVLINAIYFKGEWTVEFEEKDTMDKQFHSPDGERTVPMMKRRDEKLPCAENDLFQAVRLPYGKKASEDDIGGGASMYVLLPVRGKTLEDLTAKLTPETWKEWTGSISMREGTIELPRFKAEFFTSLNSTLKNMGMKEAFGKRADFSRLCECRPGQVYISDVLHKAVIEVNEKGTEAAAVTAIVIRTTSAMPTEKPFHMVVDRPFLLAIVDDETGLILFMGAISDPESLE